MQFLSTMQVSRILKVTPSRLSRAVWDGRIEAPEKTPSGDFMWTPEDIDRASRALLHRAFRGLVASPTPVATNAISIPGEPMSLHLGGTVLA